jgi:hypothetical protein
MNEEEADRYGEWVHRHTGYQVMPYYERYSRCWVLQVTNERNAITRLYTRAQIARFVNAHQEVSA